MPLYHPVPLELIRGLAKKDDLLLGRIVTTDEGLESGISIYYVNVAALPNRTRQKGISPDTMGDLLFSIYDQNIFKANRIIFNGDFWSFELWAYAHKKEAHNA